MQLDEAITELRESRSEVLLLKDVIITHESSLSELSLKLEVLSKSRADLEARTQRDADAEGEPVNTSVAVLTEILLRSPRKTFIFIINKII